MSNHYHLFLRTPQPNLSAGMHDLNSGYASLFNRRSGSVCNMPTVSSAEFWQQRLQKLFAKSRVVGRYFSTSADRLKEVAAYRGVHHVDNAISLGRG